MLDKVGDCRPISNVSFLSKVIEGVVADQLQALLENTDALDTFQSALVTLQENLLREADEQYFLVSPP